MSFIEELKAWDADLLLNINGAHSAFWDHSMFIYTRKETWVLFYAVLLIMLVKQFGRRVWLLVPLIALTITFTDQACNLFKYGFARPRPGHDPIIGDLVYIFFKKGGRYGFVSAHSANAFALVAFLAGFVRNRWFTLTMVVWAALVAFSRVYLGVHYPGDIFGGMLLGLSIGYGMHKLALYLEPKVYKTGRTQYDSSSVSANDLLPYFVIYTVMMLLPLLMNWMYLAQGYIQ